jgi:hypothetical protein
MRFMIIIKATPGSEAGQMPGLEMLEVMSKYHQQLAAAGVLVDASGLHPSSKGWRVMYQGSQRSVIDGPFAETKELIAGYTTVQVRSETEAREWALKFPNPSLEGGSAQIEIRRLFELDELEPCEAVESFRRLPGINR